MNMKRSVVFLAAMAALIMFAVTGCGGEGSGGGSDNYTVTFNRNNDDASGATDANPQQVSVSSGGTLGNNMPDPPTRSKGWGAGMKFFRWTTDQEGKNRFEKDTPVKGPMTVYAQWRFEEGEPVVSSDTNTVTINGLEITSSTEGTHSTFAGDINSDGSITWWNGAIRWGFPTTEDFDFNDYDYVEIEYVGIGATAAARDIPSNDMKQYGAGGYKPIKIGTQANDNLYPTIPLNSSLTYIIKEATGTEKGVAIRANKGSSLDIENKSVQRTMKFSKATFTKGTRYTVTFDLDYTNATPIPDMQALVNVAIGPLPSPSRTGYVFTGWINKSGNSEVTATFVVTGALNLKATWDQEKDATADLTVNFLAADKAGLTAVGNGTTADTPLVVTDSSSTNGYTFTYGSGGYQSSWVKFKVTLETGIRLSGYKEVTFSYRSVSGDTQNKDLVLLAGATLPGSFSSNPTSGDYQVSTAAIRAPNAVGNWTTGTFTINTSKVGGLTGTIEVCIYDHSANTDTSNNKTVWEIRDVVFKKP